MSNLKARTWKEFWSEHVMFVVNGQFRLRGSSRIKKKKLIIRLLSRLDAISVVLFPYA